MLGHVKYQIFSDGYTTLFSCRWCSAVALRARGAINRRNISNKTLWERILGRVLPGVCKVFKYIRDVWVVQ